MTSKNVSVKYKNQIVGDCVETFFVDGPGAYKVVVESIIDRAIFYEANIACNKKFMTLLEAHDNYSPIDSNDPMFDRAVGILKNDPHQVYVMLDKQEGEVAILDGDYALIRARQNPIVESESSAELDFTHVSAFDAVKSFLSDFIIESGSIVVE